MPAFPLLFFFLEKDTAELVIVISVCFTFAEGANCVLYHLAIRVQMEIMWLPDL